MRHLVVSALFGIVVALAALSTALCIGCGTGGFKAWSGVFAGCEKSDLGQLVTLNGLEQTVEQAVAGAISKGESGIAADLAAVAAQLGGTVASDTIGCAITAFEQSFAPATGSAGSAALAKASLRVKPTAEIALARDWVAKHRWMKR